MGRLDLRVRLLGLALKSVSVARLDDAGLAKLQTRKVGHNPLLDRVMGAVAAEVDLHDTTVTGPDGEIPLRVYRPSGPVMGPRALVVHLHGGGWTVGSLDQGDWLCSNVAARVGAVVVSVDYRLAPAHRFPAAAEDCYAALVAAVARAAEWGADPERLAVMGDSAGGNLAAAVTLMSRDRSGPRISFQGLLYPATDLSFGSPSIRENAHAPILTRADMVAFRDHYLGDQDPAQPYVSPLVDPNHARLPRALVQVAEFDPLRDDGLRYADALRAAGVPVRVTQYVGMPHGYLSFPGVCRCAPQALAELCTELSEALAPVAAPAN